MIAPHPSIKNKAQKMPNPDFVKGLQAFINQHRDALNLRGDAFDEYFERAFGNQPKDGIAFANLDKLPNPVRLFAELQHRLAGRNVGLSILNSSFAQDLGAPMGPETEKHRIKRKNREWWAWFQRYMESMQIYINIFQDTVKVKNNSRQAVRLAYTQIEEELKENREAQKEVNSLVQKKKVKEDDVKSTRSSLKKREENLKQEKRHLKKYEKEILNPIEKELESDDPPPATELARIQRKLTYSMPIRAYEIFCKAMKAMKNSFNKFPKLTNRYEGPAPAPAATAAPAAHATYTAQASEDPLHFSTASYSEDEMDPEDEEGETESAPAQDISQT